MIPQASLRICAVLTEFYCKLAKKKGRRWSLMQKIYATSSTWQACCTWPAIYDSTKILRAGSLIICIFFCEKILHFIRCYKLNSTRSRFFLTPGGRRSQTQVLEQNCVLDHQKRHFYVPVRNRGSPACVKALFFQKSSQKTTCSTTNTYIKISSP